MREAVFAHLRTIRCDLSPRKAEKGICLPRTRLFWRTSTKSNLLQQSRAVLVHLGVTSGFYCWQGVGAYPAPQLGTARPRLPNQCNRHPSCPSIGPQRSKAAEQQTTPRAPSSRHAAQLAAQDGV